MSDGPIFPEPEYLRRQSALLSQLDINSILLVPTNKMKVRSHDVHFPFRASSDILYLTGWEEPKALFVGHHDGTEWKTTLFVQDNNELAERWEGGESAYLELRRDGLLTMLEIGRPALMF